MPFCEERTVKNDIKNNDLKYCYIVFGDDRYLKKHLVEKLSAAVADKDDCFNYQRFDNDSSLQDVYDALASFPMMSDKKCVILKDYNFEASDKNDFERLKTLVSDNIETSVFIIWFDYYEFDVKKSDRFKKLCTAAEKGNARLTEVNFRSIAELSKMLCDGAEKRGCSLKKETAVFMVETVGAEIETLKNELEKVCAFANGNEITEETVKKVCVKTVEQSVYNLSGKILSGDVNSALSILDELFFMRVAPMIIFYTVAGVYVDLCRAFDANVSGVNINDAAKQFGYKNRAFLLTRASNNARKLNRDILTKSLEELLYTDKRMKSYSCDYRETLEEMIVRLAFVAAEGKRIDKA